MSNNKQSSVDWVIDEIMKHQMTFYGTSSMPLRIIEQAKAMHKEEIINIVVWCDDTDRKPQQIKIEAEQYYNEKYGGNNEQQ